MYPLNYSENFLFLLLFYPTHICLTLHQLFVEVLAVCEIEAYAVKVNLVEDIEVNMMYTDKRKRMSCMFFSCIFTL